MLMSLWNYLRGYVIIEVTGFSVERFVNLAVHKGIYIWDAIYSEDGVKMKVSIKAFKMLKECARKTKCHTKIVGKIGYPFAIHKYRKRKFLLAGLFFFVTVLYTLSTFIWLIEIKGNDRISSNELMEFCREEGFAPGTWKFKTDIKEIETKILNNYKDISWINIGIKGTKVTINLNESLLKKEYEDKSKPCDIVAKKDGLILNIVTSSGTPMVKKQDVVHKGDILVKGELLVKDEETVIIREYVHSDANIIAELYYDINFEVPYKYYEKEFTGNEKKSYAISFFGKNVSFPSTNNNFENYMKTTSRKQFNLGEDYPLPIIFFTTQYREFNEKEETRTKEQAKELAERMLIGRIIREFDFDIDIMDKKIEFKEGNPNFLGVAAIVTTAEEIGQKIFLEIKEETKDLEKLEEN